MKKLFFIALATFCLADCTKKPTEQELAATHLQRAETLFAEEALEAAKLQIDSLNNLYPNQVQERKKAQVIFTKIKLIEQQRNLNCAEKLLPAKQHEFDSIAKKFVFEKNKQYQDVGTFVYKAQPVGTCLRPYVEESGQLMLTSLYRGERAVEHSAAKLSTGNLLVETETVTDDGYNYRFKDGELFFETVTYTTNNDAIAAFVETNADKTITVTLQGDKRKTTFWLSVNEKKAIVEARNLSVVLTDLRRLQHTITTAEKKIVLYNIELSEMK